MQYGGFIFHALMTKLAINIVQPRHVFMTGQMRITFKIHITFNNMTKYDIPEKQTGKTIQDYRHILVELPLVNQLLRFANNKVISRSFCKCK